MIRKNIIAALLCFLAAHAAGGQPPNIVFILADDLGWGDLQCYGNPYVETPALNKLAAEGIQFTDYYSPSPLCAPARAALLTGRFNHRTGAIDVSSNRGIDRIALSEVTIGDYFKHAGYATALIGKWHNGLYSEPYLPHHRGFDLFYGFPNGGQDFYAWNLMRNGVSEEHDGRYMTDVFNEEAIKFIEAQKDRPFFLFLAHHAIHPPFQAPDALVRKYINRIGDNHTPEAAVMYAMIEAMDEGIGRIIAKLEALNIRDNTIVVFTSDNGAFLSSKSKPRFHGPFSGEKGNVFEQGIRVPAIVSWKGVIPEGKIVRTPLHGCDWLPTLYSVSGKAVPHDAKPLDGVNVMPLLRGNEMSALEDRPLFFQKNRYTPVGHSDGAVRQGKWKLYWPMVPNTMKKDIARDNPAYQKGMVEPHWEMPLDTALPLYKIPGAATPQLFNLEEDPAERYDVAADHPDVVNALVKSYDAWFADVYRDWEMAWREVKAQDEVYWKRRKVPDPLKLFDGYWHWKAAGLDAAVANPLEVFEGYWSGQKKFKGNPLRRDEK